MAKKTVDIESLALEALALALTDPEPKLLFASGAVAGFFKGATQPVKAAARLCEDRQWLTPTDDWHGKGKTRKQKYRLSPAGSQAVLQHSEPLVVLRSLATALQQQTTTFQAIHQQLGRLLGGLQPLADTVGQLTRRLEPPNIEELLRRLNGAPAAAASPSSPPDWFDAAVRLVSEQQQRDRYQPLSLPQLYAALRQTRPGLTLGQFHDGLRLLRDQGRVRLAPFTRALATIDDARNALFLDGEVMYYVELP
jgi:hypothetical protein